MKMMKIKKQTKIKINCIGCGKEFEVYEKYVDMGRKYCTMPCYRLSVKNKKND